MVTLPGTTPDTTPVLISTVATLDVALVQVPPKVASVKIIVCDWQTFMIPPIGPGDWFTVTVVVLKQPVPKL